jgi:uncharacterized membrane protein YphA (DoxX/SURF4 family)
MDAHMVTRGFTVLLALLRIFTGLSLILSGTHKLGWFAHPELLQNTFTTWGEHPANHLVTSYLGFVSAHHGLFARLVVLGELGVGLLLLAGFLTPLAALLGFVMVASFHFASSAMFGLGYLTGQSGLVYLFVFPVLMLGRAGTALGVDGALARGAARTPP